MVFDVDKLKEALDSPVIAIHKHMDKALRTRTEVARLVVAGQPLRQCGGHDELGNCVMVEGWWMPTGKDET